MGFMTDVLVLMYSDTEMWHKDRKLAYVLLMGVGASTSLNPGLA